MVDKNKKIKMKKGKTARTNRKTDQMNSERLRQRSHHQGRDEELHYHVPNYPTETPIAYHAVISFFRFILAIFFSRIVIENPDRIPGNGRPTIVLVNHSNSLTDALIIMASVPRHARRMLRMTAKATHFRKPNFSSWLIEKAGSVPLQRAQDYQPETRIDNSGTRELLVNALCQQGDAICIFPEGISRYHPALAPFKTGAARIASDVLCQFKDQSNFELNLLPCSITYLHRQNFRSDVLVSFHDPIILNQTNSTHQDLVSTVPETRKKAIGDLTTNLTEKIRSGTLDSPSWDLIKAANMARTLYAPFGTQLSLGAHIRLTQRFVDVFAGRTLSSSSSSSSSQPSTPALSPSSSSNHERLVKDLLEYQQMLFSLGLKDARVANNRLVNRRVMFPRLIFRIAAAAFFTTICAPGLFFWIPTFIVTGYFAHRQRLKGPAWDTYDEVTQTKMLWGLATGLMTYGSVLLICFPIFPIVLVVFPIWMWFTLRWLEDLVATLRATRSLVKMLMISKSELKTIRNQRSILEKEVYKVAVDCCLLPTQNQDVLRDDQQQEIVIKNGKVTNSRFDYFSIRRRRKKDYNEVLRLWDLVDM
ncbi:hypothetical protein MJO29_009220 [Puccinia striiformis f. sp. tritici]|uniref:Phospholipid/glycerol acyltransferase domain-containing protein n=1 Tax=Puccinia striiformis TaxID=27350 RepID=A0A2S4UUY4_9BASI|nr:hypothetical protein Pst134EB_018602 [Puccinia striiformis f. sp. tritici]KAI7950546.1 hypothetical protein MJO29_009220 [Puccinia striiformis f. sp. tritici]POW01098.1 hypothetical protein PSTT_12695 [Puccinia striiformis]